MSKRKQTTRRPAAGRIADDPADTVADDLAYLTQWAASLAASVTPAELRSAVKGYEAIARNGKLPDEDRRLARSRAKALRANS